MKRAILCLLFACGPHAANDLRLPPYKRTALPNGVTLLMMEQWGIPHVRMEYSRFAVVPTSYSGRTYRVEPDASSASYFFAAAAVSGGRRVFNHLRAWVNG